MIFAIKPFEIHDGDGIRTTVFFKGCSLRCRWCHNPESLSPRRDLLYRADRCLSCLACTSLCDANVKRENGHVFLRERCVRCGRCVDVCRQNAFEMVGDEPSAQEIARRALRDELFMKSSGGGVTFSGGEPLLQIDLCVEVAKLIKERGVDLAIDSCAQVPRTSIERIAPYTDTFLFDLKAIDPEVHQACTGSTNEHILDNIRYADSLGIPIEIRYPFVPSMNDGEAEAIADFVQTLKGVKLVRILPYHSYAVQKYHALGLDDPLPQVTPPDAEQLSQAAARMQARTDVKITIG